MLTETYKNKTIDIQDFENESVLLIDGNKINFNTDPDSKQFFSNTLSPYEKFSTLEKLARSIIDNMGSE